MRNKAAAGAKRAVYEPEPTRTVRQADPEADAINDQESLPSRRQVRAALAKYANLDRPKDARDVGDVAAVLREELRDLAPARASATARLLGD